MGILSESESERAVRENNDGQKAGSQATALDKVVHRIGGNTGYSDAYNKGWENGVNNPAPKEDFFAGDNNETCRDNSSDDTSEDYKGSEASSSSSYSGSSSSSGDTSGSSGAGALLLVVIAIVGVIILVVNGLNATKWTGNAKEVWVTMNVNTTMLNVRSGPGTDSPVIA